MGFFIALVLIGCPAANIPGSICGWLLTLLSAISKPNTALIHDQVSDAQAILIRNKAVAIPNTIVIDLETAP